MRVWIQFRCRDAPILKVFADSQRIEIVGTWGRDWKLPKTDIERFFIDLKQRAPLRLLVHAKAHYGIQRKRVTIKDAELTVRFEGISHAPVGIWEGHAPLKRGYEERGFTFKFYEDRPRYMEFGKLKGK